MSFFKPDELSEDPSKQEKKNKRRDRKNRIKETVRVVLMCAMLLFLLNKLFLKLELFDEYKAADALGSGIKPSAEISDGEAAVYFLDVGQGDCSLIMVGGINILIDCGDLDCGNVAAGALKSLGIKRLDYVILTHPHVDHFGGLFEILQVFEVGQFLVPNIPDDMIPRTYNYSKLIAALELYGVTARKVSSGDKLSLGEGAALEIAAPLYNDYGDLNNLSVVARFTHKNNSFLFTGDLEEAAERDLLEAGISVKADVLKAGHHGSAGSSSAEFLEAVSPKTAVFEAGVYNTFGHPRAEVLERLAGTSCENAFSTSLNGNILMISDGSSIRTVTEKNSAVSLDFYR